MNMYILIVLDLLPDIKWIQESVRRPIYVNLWSCWSNFAAGLV